MHHIKYVEIKKNGTIISKSKYSTQPTNSIFTYTYNVPAEKGDVFQVTVTCNLWGHTSSTLVVVAPEPVAEKPLLEKVSITLNVKFDTAKAIIKKKYHNDIKIVANFMKEYPDTTAVIEGYTDNVDKFNNPENNIKLSQARADSVRQYLIDNFGIDASRITAVGYGPNKPIASNKTKKGRQKNRRVQAVIGTVQTK